MRWLLLLLAGCGSEVLVESIPEPVGLGPRAVPFGCMDEGGYAVSARLTTEERAAVYAGVARWNATHVPIALRDGEDHRCTFTVPDSDAGRIALGGVKLPPDYYGAIHNLHEQRLVVALACGPACRVHVVYWGIAMLSGVEWDYTNHAKCISNGECPP